MADGDGSEPTLTVAEMDMYVAGAFCLGCATGLFIQFTDTDLALVKYLVVISVVVVAMGYRNLRNERGEN